MLNQAFFLYITHTFDSKVSLHSCLLWPTVRRGVRRGVGLDEGHELSPTMSTLNEGQKQGRVRERGGAGGKGEHTSSSS